MKTIIIATAALLLGASTAAFAQAPATDVPGFPGAKIVPIDNAAPTPTPAQGMGMRKQLASNLQKAGYTDIKIVPEAFIVQAVNKAGDPVRMFISPDSMTVFTATSAKGQDATTVPGEPKDSAPSK
jgi:hypothetical protein